MDLILMVVLVMVSIEMIMCKASPRAKASGILTTSQVPYSVAQSSGPQKSNGIEGRFFVSEDKVGNQFYAVFDGHLGQEVSDYLEKHSYESLAPIIKRFTENLEANVDDLKNEIKTAIMELDERIRSEVVSSSKVSSTLCYVINTKKHLISVNVGDSRALMLDINLQALPLTDDHRPASARELERIISRGSWITTLGLGWQMDVSRVESLLAMSRAMGDFSLKTTGGLTSEPDVLVFVKNNGARPVNSPVIVLLASDGVWDVVSNHEAARTILAEVCPSSEIKRSDKNAYESRALKMANGVTQIMSTSRKRGARADITIVGAMINPNFTCSKLKSPR